MIRPTRLWLGATCLALAALLATPVAAQNGAATAAETDVPKSVTLTSPKSTLRSFVQAMRVEPQRLADALACMDLSTVSRDRGDELANQLYRSLNRIEYIDFVGDSSLLDEKQLGLARYEDLTSWEYFPGERLRNARGASRDRIKRVQKLAGELNIVLERQSDGRWLFSAATVENTALFWGSVKQLEQASNINVTEKVLLSEWIESQWPATFKSTPQRKRAFLGIELWQWLTLFALIVIGVVIDHTVRFFLTRVSLKMVARRGGEVTRETVRRMVRPFGLAVAAVFALFFVKRIGLGDEPLQVLALAVRLFAMLSMVWAAFRVTDLVGEVAANKAEHTDTKWDNVLVPLVRKAVKIFVAAFGLIYIAESLNVPIAPLVAGLTVGGAGFAFAAKDTLENIFGSLTVIVDRPFEVGDWVTIGDVEGTVEELGFRSTRVRTFYNSLVTVPNGNLVRANVDNHGRRKYRRWKTHLNLTYDTAPDAIEAFCEGVREIIRRHPYTRKDYYQVWMHQFGAHSLDVLVYMFFEAPDWSTELRERHRLILDLIRLADQLGVEFAFPTQTLHMYREEHGAEHVPGAVPETDARRDAYIRGRRAARETMRQADWRQEKPPPYVFDTAEDDQDPETQIESRIGGDA